MTEENRTEASDFIRDMIKADLAAGKHTEVVTRFPPEPNGYLHIGHAKSICLNSGIARQFNGRFHLRFDDTNPAKEEQEYIDSIMADVRWLGADWGEHLYYASDYFERMYAAAVELIEKGLAYVCTLTPEEFKDYRGVPTAPGKPSPWRDRAAAESLDLFDRMRKGEFTEGQYVLRAKIDMASPNLHMRDPVIYRIKHAVHPHTGTEWCIYPMYDFAHCLEDAFEGITHSICTLEFEVHRPLYDWILDNVTIGCHPQQIEFARLNLSYTVMSKRKLLELVKGGLVKGWDDPRMPTVCGLRRRGYTPESIRRFCATIGVTKFDGMTDIALLEHCIRDELNKTAPRVMGVLDPVKVVIENWPAGQVDELEGINNPEDPESSTRKVPFSGELYIERDDFREDAPKKYFRLAPGREVRLRYGYFITCTGFEKDADGNVTLIRCTYDPETRGGNAPDGRKVKGTIHWVSAAHALPADVRLYDRLFSVEKPDDVPDGGDYKDFLNPDSCRVITAMLEPSLKDAAPGTRVQFERKGYFFTDPVDSKPGQPVFNQIVPLKDSWAKMEKRQG